MSRRSDQLSGRRSPTPVRRQSSAVSWKTPDPLETSRSSVAASSSSSLGGSSTSGSGRNPFNALLRAIASLFFGQSKTKSGSLKDVQSSQTSSAPTPRSWQGSHSSNDENNNRRSSKGSYGAGRSTSGRACRTSKFTIEEILKATNNFNPSLNIGQGGFGIVYKGTFRDGTVVAVKRAKKNLLDAYLTLEFQNEIKILGQIEHLNLVRFYGYMEDCGERVIVLEYVPNGTLREHLDGIYGSHLDLPSRLDIAIDVAHAVTYLHMYTDHPIIHRDIKSSNVLLTEKLRAKVADFGFARLAENEAGVTHISTQVKGTAGYLDPEYLKTYQLTEKSDVYSFGVLLIEIITGRRPIEIKRKLNERITARWATKNFSEGNAMCVLDPNVPCTAATNLALEKILELALQCLGQSRQDRPSMRTCAQILWNIRKDFRDQLALDSPSPSTHLLSSSVTRY